jgi:hypothetical protein
MGMTWYQEEHYASKPFDLQVSIGPEYWYSGSGSCSQEASEHWLTVETSDDQPQSSPPCQY